MPRASLIWVTATKEIKSLVKRRLCFVFYYFLFGWGKKPFHECQMNQATIRLSLTCVPPTTSWSTNLALSKQIHYYITNLATKNGRGYSNSTSFKQSLLGEELLYCFRMKICSTLWCYNPWYCIKTKKC